MSSLLYSVGLLVCRRRLRVLGIWALIAVVVIALAGVTGGTLVDDFTISGTESQRGIDTLAQRFPQASGTTGQIVLGSTSGPISSQQSAVEARVRAVEKVAHVTSVDDPFAPGAVGTVSPDGRYALVQVQFDVAVTALPATTVPAVERAARPPAAADLTATLGGAMYTSTGVGLSMTELIGVGVALLVLAVTFSSLVAAGLPLLTAALGVGATLAGVLTVASFTMVSSTTPTLALMIGLAVGIDYGLFIVFRHRRQLAAGMPVAESVAESLATAGSAVVFAGLTVIIALAGLAVARIPFLTVMGAAAAVGVAVAVLVALTLLPAGLALLGERLRPRPRSHATRVLAATGAARGTMGARWVALATRVPVLTVVVVLAVIGALAYPVKDLVLALPDNGSADAGTPQRTTYDLVSAEFGPGYNAPLLVTADVITSTDPRGVVSNLADDLEGMDGVAAVTKETPNSGGDLGLVRLVPEGGQSDPRTGDLVNRIRARAPALEQQLGVHDLLVTGQTAVAIDVSDRLGAALLPFGAVIVGLSLLLLAVVFRSVAVPLKATLGYLLSIGAALGAVTAVFTWGWLATPLHVAAIGPLVSFMPIIVMGVLFGLAMDYEVFLVSQMREDFVRGHDPRHAVTTGFTASARVVTAAAVIMVAVFAAFVPHGNATIKPIALGLAVGVTVDAFVVRMTLVPAVLALLGRHAWWIPRWLDRLLPVVDVEGHAMVVRAEQAAWERTHGTLAVRAERLVLPWHDGTEELDLQVVPGTCASVTLPDPLARTTLTWALAGRFRPQADHLAVLGHVLPDEARAVRRQVRVVATPDPADDDRTVDQHLARLLRLQSRRLRARRGAVARARQQAEAWLGATVGPAALEHRRLGSLDPLTRRLVALAGARALAPRLLVVEDADVGLAPAQVEALTSICGRLCTDGTTVVLVSEREASPPAAHRVTVAHVPPARAERLTEEVAR